MKNLLIFTSIFFLALKAQSQNVGIGTSTPATILDVVSTTQGVLIPRVTTLQMNAIASPANGLLVTNIDSLNRIFIYTGTAWKGLSFTDQNVDTALLVHRINDETIDGIKTFKKDIVVNKIHIGTGNNSRNVIVGVLIYCYRLTMLYPAKHQLRPIFHHLLIQWHGHIKFWGKVALHSLMVCLSLPA